MTVTKHRRDRTPAERRRFLRRRIVVGSLAVVVVAVVVATVSIIVDLSSVHRSDIEGAPQQGGDTNILVMGLDSRVDQNGKPLPQDIYDAINAGDQSDGGYNANVLMLIHIPADGGKAVGISIPRDDYVDYPTPFDGTASGKIKEVYGLAMDQKERELAQQGLKQDDAYQQARAYARQQQIKTVSAFLGDVPVDHFVEITMAAFYRVAQAVQPITVCLNHATQDAYSGANFPAGVQELTAAQAMSFVRQRRDTGPSDLELTDLDRTRRQQAFIVSLATKLKNANTFTNPGTVQSLIDTAKQYVALDSSLNLLSFAGQAQGLAGGNMTFVTLPIQSYGVRDGKDVNLVDLPAIRAQVHDLLNPPTPGADTGGAAPASPDASAPASTDSTTPPASTPPATTNPPGVYTDATSPLQSGGVPCVN